jgi:hypothetical protein
MRNEKSEIEPVKMFNSVSTSKKALRHRNGLPLDSAGALVLDALVGGGAGGGEREEAGGGAGDAEGGRAPLLLLQCEGPGCAVSAQRHHCVSEVRYFSIITFFSPKLFFGFFVYFNVLQFLKPLH